MTPNRNAARLFIIDFDVVGYSGHFFNQVFGFREAARAHKVHPRVFIPRNAPTNIARALDARTILPPNATYYLTDRDEILEAISDSHRALRPLWDAIEAERVCARDILLITSSRPALI